MSTETDETEIRALLERWRAALCAKDIGGLADCTAPDTLLFDIMPPLQFEGIAACQKLWETILPECPDPFFYEISQLKIAVGDAVAVSHSLQHMTGGEHDSWIRATTCFRKVNGQWLIAHEHYSVPIDMEKNQPLMNLKP